MWSSIILPVLKEIGITIAKGAGLGLGAGISMKAVNKAFPDKNPALDTMIDSAKNLAATVTAAAAVKDAEISEIKKSMADSQSAMNNEISEIKKSVAGISVTMDNKISEIADANKNINTNIDILARSISELKPSAPSPAPPTPAIPPAPPVVPPVA